MSKYLRIISDLHLEQYSGRDPLLLEEKFLPKDERDSNSILVLAGDISSRPSQTLLFLRTVESRFEKVIYVLGNHEHYRQHMDEVGQFLEYEIGKMDNVVCSYNGVSKIEHFGFSIHFCTLWGDGGNSEEDLAKVQNGLSDFYVIQCGEPPSRFTARYMQVLHKEQKAKLKDDLAKATLPKIVITHHMPSRRLVSPRFIMSDGSDGINGGFVGACEDILAYEELAPKLWIHGHTHSKIDTSLWKTRIICNPAGYYSERFYDDIGGQVTFVDLTDLIKNA